MTALALVQRYAGLIVQNATASAFEENLPSNEKLAYVLIQWESSAACQACNSYPAGKIEFVFKLQDYENRPSVLSKLRSYSLLGSATVWLFSNRKWRLKDWHRLVMSDAGVLEIPRGINMQRCIISHPISMFPTELIPNVYVPLPKRVDAISCPECFIGLERPSGITDNFDASGCSIVRAVGSYAICVPVPDCVPVPPLPAYATEVPGLPIIPVSVNPSLMSFGEIPGFISPPPCFKPARIQLRTSVNSANGVTSTEITTFRSASDGPVCFPAPINRAFGGYAYCMPLTNSDTGPLSPTVNFRVQITTSGTCNQAGDGNPITYTEEWTSYTDWVPCTTTLGATAYNRCVPVCSVSGTWNVLVKISGSSPTVGGSIPTQYARHAIPANQCCRPSLEKLPPGTPGYDEDFPYYGWSYCGNIIPYNQPIQNIYSPEVVVAVFIPDS